MARFGDVAEVPGAVLRRRVDDMDGRCRAIHHRHSNRLLISSEVSAYDSDTVVVQLKDVRGPVHAVARTHAGLTIDGHHPTKSGGNFRRHFLSHRPRR